ncbi:MAG: hypothetical protein O3A00_03810 [Planctomycetota bacterium]|nr:hypothetical protein [Planctomycetota bacterium]
MPARFGVIESVTCEEGLAEFAEQLRDKLEFPEDKAQAASDEVRAFSRFVNLAGTLEAVSLHAQ